MAALRIGAAESIRRHRPATGEASRAGGGLGTARAVHPRHHRPGSMGPVDRRRCPGSVRSSSIGPAGVCSSPVDFARHGYRAVRRRPVARGPRRTRHRPHRRRRWFDRRRLGAQPGRAPSRPRRPDRAARWRTARLRRAASRASSGSGRRRSARSSSGCPMSHGPAPIDPSRERTRPEPRAGRIPDEFIDWRLALANDTVVDAPRARHGPKHRPPDQAGGRASCSTIDDLGRIEQPTLIVYGTADPTGSVDLWRRVIGALPHGELEVMDGAGHQPWFEDVSLSPLGSSRFLADRPGGPQPPRTT